MKTIIKKWLGIDRFEECKECGVLCHRNKMKKIKAYILDEKTKVIESYCKNHAPKFDVIVYADVFSLPTYYMNNVQVNEQGKPICTKK